MQPSKEQIENAARLVPEHVYEGMNGHLWTCSGNNSREWQPWADTEAGRSDALVLLAAVVAWFWINRNRLGIDLWRLRDALYAALDSGNVQQIQAATFTAAAAIGAHMNGVEGE